MVLSYMMEEIATEINAKFQEYNEEKSVIVVPLEGGRFQTVFGTIEQSEKYNHNRGIEIKTTVCDYFPEIDLKKLLVESARFCHAKFVLEDEILKVEASAYVASATKELLKEIILEVAKVADDWEKILTGKDVN